MPETAKTTVISSALPTSDICAPLCSELLYFFHRALRVSRLDKILTRERAGPGHVFVQTRLAVPGPLRRRAVAESGTTACRELRCGGPADVVSSYVRLGGRPDAAGRVWK